jgi:hypothetical protein
MNDLPCFTAQYDGFFRLPESFPSRAIDYPLINLIRTTRRYCRNHSAAKSVSFFGNYVRDQQHRSLIIRS